MDPFEAALDLLDVIDVATRTLTQLRRLSERWGSAPKEVFELRDKVASVRQLLESAHGARQHTADVVKKPGSETHKRGLNLELASVRETLNELEILLGHVQVPPTLRVGNGGVPGDPDLLSKASMKAQWSIHREQAAKLLTKVTDSNQRILASLALLNVVISANPAVSLSRAELVPSQALQRSLDRDFDIDRLKFRSEEAGLKFGHIKHQTRYPRPEIRSDVDQLCTETSQLDGLLLEQIGQPVAVRLRKTPPSPQDHIGGRARYQMREVHNEQRFQHLEGLLATITSTPGSQDQPSSSSPVQWPLSSSRRTGKPFQGCVRSCKCRCHINGTGSATSVAAWSLSAFRSTLGSISFVFATKHGSRKPCDVTGCTAPYRDSNWYHVTYSFPSWLFHTSITAIFTNSSGTPELVLRVLYRVDLEPYASAFGALKRGEIDNIKRMLQHKECSIFDITQTGISLLQQACIWRQFDIMELLLHEGADIYQADDFGQTPCHYIIRMIYTQTQLPLWSSLLGVSPLDDMMEYCGLTDLHKVVMGIRSIDVREYLRLNSKDINTGDTRGQTPLFYASARADVDTVQALLDAGADCDGVPPTMGSSALQTACLHRHVAVVEKLVDAGASIHPGYLGMTPLHNLCRSPMVNRGPDTRDSIRIASKLLNHGTDINAETKQYLVTALDFACMCDNSAAFIRFLLAQGADPDHRDWEGTNALGNAIAHNALESVALLRGRESSRRNIDDNDLDIVQYLALFATVEMMELFMDSAYHPGLDTTREDNQGQTALQLFNERTDTTDQLRQTFMCLLSRISETNACAEAEAEDIGDTDSELDFFDALEG